MEIMTINQLLGWPFENLKIYSIFIYNDNNSTHADYVHVVLIRFKNKLHFSETWFIENKSEWTIEFLLTSSTQSHLCAYPKPEHGFPISYFVFLFNSRWVEVRGVCSLCRYLWNCWPSLPKLSFHNYMLIPELWYC